MPKSFSLNLLAVIFTDNEVGTCIDFFVEDEFGDPLVMKDGQCNDLT